HRRIEYEVVSEAADWEHPDDSDAGIKELSLCSYSRIVQEKCECFFCGIEKAIRRAEIVACDVLGDFREIDVCSRSFEDLGAHLACRLVLARIDSRKALQSCLVMGLRSEANPSRIIAS